MSTSQLGVNFFLKSHYSHIEGVDQISKSTGGIHHFETSNLQNICPVKRTRRETFVTSETHRKSRRGKREDEEKVAERGLLCRISNGNKIQSEKTRCDFFKMRRKV